MTVLRRWVGRRHGRLVAALVVLAIPLGLIGGLRGAEPLPAVGAERAVPPLTPRWAYEPWVWDDVDNTAQAVRDLVDGYRSRAIPVGAVIIDSPWATAYNTFVFGQNYPDPVGLIDELHGQGVRVALWTTGFLNVSGTPYDRHTFDTRPGSDWASNYGEAYAARYFVDDGALYSWWQGQGSAIDFFNPNAVAWWYAQMDRAFDLGVDGWKVDKAETALGQNVATSAGSKTRREYSTASYRAFHGHVAARGPSGVVMARAYDHGATFAPVDAVSAGWVGDQPSTWRGLTQALDYILASAELGYSMVGSDIAGRGEQRDDPDGRLFLRWTELGALSPFMENGGRGEHRPWLLGAAALAGYRYYATLHHELVPYLFSAGVDAHEGGPPIIQGPQRDGRQYLLGPDLLVAPIVGPRDERTVELPGGRWYDYWDDDRVLVGPATQRVARPMEQIPLFIRGGAIIPLQADSAVAGHGGPGSAGRLTLLIYPDQDSSRIYHPDTASSVVLRSHQDQRGVAIDLGASAERYVLRIKAPTPPASLMIDRGGGPTLVKSQASWSAFEAASEACYYDSTRRYLWVRFDTAAAGARLTYATAS